MCSVAWDRSSRSGQPASGWICTADDASPFHRPSSAVTVLCAELIVLEPAPSLVSATYQRGRLQSWRRVICAQAVILSDILPRLGSRCPRRSGTWPCRASSWVATLLGIDQPKVSALLRGRLRGFSLERLLSFLIALDQDVDIVVRHKIAQHSRLSVIAS